MNDCVHGRLTPYGVAEAVTVTRAWWQVCGAANACVVLQSSDVCEQILRVVSRSSRLEELVLENAGLRM